MGEELSDRLRISMKFERMMGHSHEELMEIGRQNRTEIPSESPGKIIGTFKYNLETGEETYTPTKEYKEKTKSQ